MTIESEFRPGAVTGYGYVKREPRVVKYIGALPPDGVWHMTLVPVSASRDAIVFADAMGKHQPRIVKDGALTMLCPGALTKPKKASR